jgi:hypothetical protein
MKYEFSVLKPSTLHQVWRIKALTKRGNVSLASSKVSFFSRATLTTTTRQTITFDNNPQAPIFGIQN